MRVLAIIVLVLAVSFLAVQIFTFWGRQSVLDRDLAELEGKLEKAEMSRNQLKADLMGYDKPENIERKVREDFNYRRPDEKMLIIIPPREIQSSSSR